MDSFGIPLIAISAAFADVIGTSPKTSAKENETLGQVFHVPIS